MKSNLSRNEKALLNNYQTAKLQAIAKAFNDVKASKDYLHDPLLNQVHSELLLLKKTRDLKLFFTDEEIDLLIYLLCFIGILRESEHSKRIETSDSELEIDTSQLVIGGIVKDYKALCELLNEPILSGKAKQLQLKNWQRFFDFQKLEYSNSYIILDIYDKPLDKASTKYKNSAFVNELKVLLLNLLSKQEVNNKGNIIFHTTFTKLSKSLGIVNQFYFNNMLPFFTNKYNGIYSEDQISWNYNLFDCIVFEKLKSLITYALTALQKDNMITLSYNNIIGVNFKNKIIYHRATEDEEAYITLTKKQVANELNFSNASIASKFKKAEFEEMLNKRYKSEYGWDLVFYQITIIVNKQNLDKHIHEYSAIESDKSVLSLSSDEVENFKLTVNHNLVGKLLDKIENLSEREKTQYIKSLRLNNDLFSDLDDEDIAAIMRLNESDSFKYNSAFHELQRELINLLLLKNTEQAIEISQFFQCQL